MKSSGEVILEGKQPGGLRVHVKKATRKARGRGARPVGGAPPTLVATLKLPLLQLQVSSITFVPKITLPKVSFRFGLCLIFLIFETLK